MSLICAELIHVAGPMRRFWYATTPKQFCVKEIYLACAGVTTF